MLRALPPVALLDAGDPLIGEPGLELQRHHEEGIVLRGQPLHGGEVQVVVVVMGDQHHVPRQVLEGEAGRHQPPRACPGQRAGPLAPVGIGEDAQAVDAQQHRRVADPGHGGIRSGAEHAARREPSAVSQGVSKVRGETTLCQPRLTMNVKRVQPPARA